MAALDIWDIAGRFDEARDLHQSDGPCSEALHSRLVLEDGPALISELQSLRDVVAQLLSARPVVGDGRCPYCEARVEKGTSHNAGCALGALALATEEAV